MMKRIKLGKLHLKEQANGELHLYFEGKSLHPISERMKKLNSKEVANVRFISELLSHYSPFVTNNAPSKRNRLEILEYRLNLIYAELVRLNSLRLVINRVTTDGTFTLNRDYVGVHLTKDADGEWVEDIMALVYIPTNLKYINEDISKGLSVVTSRTPIKYLDLEAPTDFKNLYENYLYVGKP